MSDARVKCPCCGEALLASKYRSLRPASSDQQQFDTVVKLNKRLTALNAELLAACRMARQYPAAITTELALDAAIAKTESEGE